jgi:hypothetical protein
MFDVFGFMEKAGVRESVNPTFVFTLALTLTLSPEEREQPSSVSVLGVSIRLGQSRVIQ